MLNKEFHQGLGPNLLYQVMYVESLVYLAFQFQARKTLFGTPLIQVPILP